MISVLSCTIFWVSLILQIKYIHIISGFKPTGLDNAWKYSNTIQMVLFDLSMTIKHMDTSTLVEEKTSLLETSGSNYLVQYCHISQERTLQILGCENLKFGIFCLMCQSLICCAVICDSKGQNNPCTGLDKPLGFQEVETLIFLDSRPMKVVRLTALGIGHFYPPGKFPSTQTFSSPTNAHVEFIKTN